jgi:putative transposase
MTRTNPQSHPDYPLHITARTNNATWFSLPLEEVWKVFEDQLFFIHHAFGVRIHGFVLMANHFHLLLSDPNAQVTPAMQWFMTETSKEINWRSGTKNHLYGTRNYRSRIDTYRYFMHVYKYIYRNPVEAGVCNSVEEYPYSTINRILGNAPLRIPLVEDTLIGQNLSETLKWLNHPVQEKDRLQMRRGLRRKVFRLMPDQKTRKVSRLEFENY